MTDTYDDWYASLPTADELGQTFDREQSDRRTRESIGYQASDRGRAERVQAYEEGFAPYGFRPATITISSGYQPFTSLVGVSTVRTQEQQQELFERVQALCDRMTPNLYGISTPARTTNQAMQGLAFVFGSTDDISPALRQAGWHVTDQGST